MRPPAPILQVGCQIPLSLCRTEAEQVGSQKGSQGVHTLNPDFSGTPWNNQSHCTVRIQSLGARARKKPGPVVDLIVGDGQTNAPASPRFQSRRKFLTASARAQLILLEVRPDHHGIDVSGLDNSRLSDVDPMRRDTRTINQTSSRRTPSDRLSENSAAYRVLKPIGGIYSRLRLILERRLKDLDKLAIKNNAKDTRQLRAAELTFTLNETRALEVLLTRRTDESLVKKITVLLRLKLLCTVDTPLTDDLRKQIREAEAEICDTTRINGPDQNSHCHNFVKEKTEAALRFLVGKIQCLEFELAHYETVILDLASGNKVFISSKVL